MGNFARSLRLALRYRWTVIASVVCSLIVAALWGANIGTLYPLVEIVGNTQSLGQWVDKGIKSSQGTIDAEAETAKRLQAEIDRAPDD